MYKSYTLKLLTESGPLVLIDIEEFVFAKKYLYWCTSLGEVGRIERSTIISASRLVDIDKYTSIKMKQF